MHPHCRSILLTWLLSNSVGFVWHQLWESKSNHQSCWHCSTQSCARKQCISNQCSSKFDQSLALLWMCYPSVWSKDCVWAIHCDFDPTKYFHWSVQLCCLQWPVVWSRWVGRPWGWDWSMHFRPSLAHSSKGIRWPFVPNSRYNHWWCHQTLGLGDQDTDRSSAKNHSQQFDCRRYNHKEFEQLRWYSWWEHLLKHRHW